MCQTREQDPLQGEMLEADFKEDTVTFKMHGRYYAKAGTYIILPIDEYEHLKRNQKTSFDRFDEMRRENIDG